MLSMHNIDDKKKMNNYYKTSDMLNLLYFFPELSPIKDLTIIENEEDFITNKKYIDSLKQNRVDTIKDRTPINEIENSGGKDCFYET